MQLCLQISLYVCQSLSQDIRLLLCKQSYDLRCLESLAIESWVLGRCPQTSCSYKGLGLDSGHNMRVFTLVPDRNNSFYLGDSGLHCQLHGVEGVNQPQVARAEPLQRSFKFSNLKFTGCCCLNSQQSTSPLLMHTALMALALCVQCALTRFQRSTHSNADLYRSIHFMLFRTGGFDGIWQNQEWLP